MSKKLIITISSIALIVALAVIFILSINKNNNIKKYDFEKIENQLLRFYSEEKGLRKLDFMDISSLFGIDEQEIPDSLFLGNITTEENVKEDMMLIILINTSEVDYYYDSLYSYIDSYKLYLEDENIIKLFDEAILKKGSNYVYLIIGEDPSLILKEIDML